MRQTLLSLLTALVTTTAALAQGWYYPENAKAEPVDQLKASANACGPAALLNATQAGDARWQKSFAAIPGATDKERIISLIRTHGMIRSSQIPTRLRYSSRSGINVADLTDMANAMRLSAWQPKLGYRLLFREEKQTPAQLLHETHRILVKSMKKGYPPVLHLQRVARRNSGKTIFWTTVKSHYVVLAGVPAAIPKNASSFPIIYLDPWGGRRLRGEIRLPRADFLATKGDNSEPAQLALSPSLITDFPDSKVGLDKIREGETTALTLATAIGDF